MKSILIIFALMLTGTKGSAQQVIASSGNSGNTSDYTVNWTIGEPVIEIFTGSNLILTQGMHQTKLRVTSVDEITIPGLEISVYPNPVDFLLKLKVDYIDDTPLNYRLHDPNGRIMLHKEMERTAEQIDMQIFPPGAYVLCVFPEDNQWQKTFNIVKK
ncbi:MAG: T9SS type A sorting domain-containing protein [Prolixibacteraceae bacterium]|nr:T9SS type A sorting domain-containing protein [Prolixibacteraceae bacterium]